MQDAALNQDINDNESDSDLGPLAWVLDEIKKSLDSATKALRRFVRDSEAAQGLDSAALDTGQLKAAQLQLQQAVGALEMVGLSCPALLLRGMETAITRFVQSPAQCSKDAVHRIERASFALSDYLDAVLAAKPSSAVALFPQYREIMELSKAERIHPADLWANDWRWLSPELALPPSVNTDNKATRALFDASVLHIMRGALRPAALNLQTLSLDLAASAVTKEGRIFWLIAAAFFEALHQGLIEADIYAKRTASRLLLQYATLSQNGTTINERLAQDLLFFCAQAVAPIASDTPVLMAVRAVYQLSSIKPIDYTQVQFGRFDPALMSQARKRIASAKETWSSICAGDSNKYKLVQEQFNLVTETLLKLHPPSELLANALTHAIEMTVHSAQAPSTELAMEVATSVLYLEAALNDLNPRDAQLASRIAYLAERLVHVQNGGEAQPLQSWMEELYRRVSDKQTMGSVVGELRIALGTLEKSLDLFFRNPQDKTVLRQVPNQLAQMRGVLSVLGLDQAAQAVQHIRINVEQILIDNTDGSGEIVAYTPASFEPLGNNLGALGFLIDMLNYQPKLAKKLFVYDDLTGELRPLMGRAKRTDQLITSVAADTEMLTVSAKAPPVLKLSEGNVVVSSTPTLTVSALPETTRSTNAGVDAGVDAVQTTTDTATPLEERIWPVEKQQNAAQRQDELQEDDLRDIFLEEAREVCANGHTALAALADSPEDISHLTILRRVFHTLKGSSRMVGLNTFGEAAWSVEQLLNRWLAEQKPATTELREICTESLNGFSRWVDDIAAESDSDWSASAFSAVADAMRLHDQRLPLNLPISPSTTSRDQSDTSDSSNVKRSQIAPTPQAMTGDEMLNFTLTQPETTPTSVLNQPPTSEENQTVHNILDEAAFLDFPDLTAKLEGPATSQEAFAHSSENENENENESESESESESVILELTDADFDVHFLNVAQSSDAPAPEETTPAPISKVIESEEPGEQTDRNADQTKVIGDLCISIPLYNVYLNEADEWSRRLVTEMSEWSLERQHPVGDKVVALAHSLAGSSATVGFHSLSSIARALENGLQKSQIHHDFTDQKNLNVYSPHIDLFVKTAEEIRRLLHQFAAGFLKTPDAALLAKLKALDYPELPHLSTMQDEDPDPETRRDIGHFSHKPLLTTPIAAPALPVPTQAITAAENLAPAFSQGKASAFEGMDLDLDLDPKNDDIDAQDAIDAELFPIFDEEVEELMPQLGGALRQWSVRLDNLGARSEVLRLLHTLKGSARLAGAMRLGEMAHRMESEIVFQGSDAAADQDFDSLHSRFDAMQQCLEGLRTAAKTSQPNDKRDTHDSAEPTSHRNDASLISEPAALLIKASHLPVPAPQAIQLQPLRQAATASVRVRSQLLDRMVNQAGEIMITRSRLEVELNQLRSSLGDMTGNLNRLRQQLREIELQAETQMQSRLAQVKDQVDFDPLEFDRFTQVQELTRMMAETVNDVATVQRTLQRTVQSTEDELVAQARQTRELQRDLLRTRMVEFDAISERLYRLVRQTAKESGKKVKLDLLGGSMEMDRGMLERLSPAFEHLLRNCVAHGIESPEQRQRAGKDAAGLITIDVRQDGNDVSLTISDDGAGLDLARIKEKALALGLMSQEQPLSDDEAADLIFQPGFSTAAELTELSGRGIGLDVVRAEVNGVGGKIETFTQAGQGTHFKLVLPLTTAVTQVVMMRAGALDWGVPANLIETVRRTNARELQQAYNIGQFDMGGQLLPFFWAGALLQSSQRSTETQKKTSPVVIVRSASQRIALHVDEVMGNREVVVKNLGPQLSRLPGLAGMSVLASGAVVLIYNPVALTVIYGQQAKRWSADSAEPSTRKSFTNAKLTAVQDTPKLDFLPSVSPSLLPLILVVDDSITVRRVTQRLLQREGYRVALAADGLQALQCLQAEIPQVVLSDIEMPRMDGFDLARNIRGDTRLAALPIIMITSRIAEKHREHAMALGVNHYLGKPFSEDELMTLVRLYCKEAPAT